MTFDLDLSPRGILSALFRQKKPIIIVGAAVTLLGLVYLLGMPKVYESRGSLLVKFGQDARPAVSIGNAAQRATEVSSSDRNEFIQSNISIIYSQDLLRQAVSAYGAEKLYPAIAETAAALGETPEAAAVRNLQKSDLLAQSGARNNVIDVTIRNKDAEVAAGFANLLIEHFIRRQAEIYNQPQTGFLHQQVQEAAAKLAASQQAFQRFKQQAGISDLDSEMEQLMRQKTELSSRAYDALTRAQATLAELETKEAEMLATYRSGAPAVRRLQQSIAAAREEVQRRQDDLNTSASSQTETSLSPKMQLIDQRIAVLEENRGTYNELQQRVRLDEESFKYYQQRGEDARANDILNQQNITRISVIDTPVVPSQPNSRKRVMLMLAVLIAAGMASVSVAVLLEILDDRVRNPAQLTSRLRVPVLATFSTKGA